jgi:2-keto-4-pentenoate hydratase
MPLPLHLATAARLLTQARMNHKRLPNLPDATRPKTPEEAYACQGAVAEGTLLHYGGHLAGYKVACTNVVAHRQLGVDGPFFGRLLSPFVFESPARVDPSRFFMRVIEAEFGFRMAADLPPAPAPRSRDEIADAVEGAIPALEIVDSRYDSWTTAGAISLIADNACNAAWVRGPLLKRWRDLDLAAQGVRVFVNGELAREGSGAAVLGHPLNALQWLVNKLSSCGVGVTAGQYMTTGVTSEVYMAEPCDRIEADFGEVGAVELTFAGP